MLKSFYQKDYRKKDFPFEAALSRGNNSFSWHWHEEMEIILVTTLRQDSIKGYISKESPLGKAILGKKLGDRVSVSVTPDYAYDVIIRGIEKGEDDESLGEIT